MSNMYDNIMSLCAEKGVSGGKLCTEIGISRGALSDLKAGRKENLSAEYVKKVADYFGVSMERVFTGEDDHLERLLDKQRTLLHRVGRLSERDEQFLLGVLDRLEESNGD